MKTLSDPRAKCVFSEYPTAIRKKMMSLRKLIIEVAGGLDEVVELEETLKWGEPSYLAKHASTIRIAWKEQTPDQYGMYFKCTSKLVPTFKEVFGTTFRYEGNRAIIFKLEEEIPSEELKICIEAALSYHKVKQLPMLGMNVDSP